MVGFAKEIMDRKYIKERARELVKGQRLTFWGGSIVMTIASGIISVIITLVSGLVAGLLTLVGGKFLGGLLGTLFSVACTLIATAISVGLSMGVYNLIKKIAEGDKVEFTDVFGCLSIAVKSAITMFLYALFISLWSLLLFVPGIIAAYKYAMVPFILLDNPEMKAMDILRASKEMMDGHKMELFILSLSFFGWIFLSMLTFGIVGFWVTPWMLVTFGVFYVYLRDGNI